MKLPSEALLPGRIYGPEWTIENVAKLLRFHANRGMFRGLDMRADARYRRDCSARHRPSGCSVIFTRDDVPGNPRGYHASICFVGETDYEPWNAEVAERWLQALFGDDRPHVRDYGPISTAGMRKGVRHFLLEVKRW
jgi:hypothetical protein